MSTSINSRKPKGRRRGCLIASLIILAPYIINFIITSGIREFNRAKWLSYDSQNYTITAFLNSLDPNEGKNIVTVSKGQVVYGENDGYCGIYPCKLNVYQRLTIESMFNDGLKCSLLFPILICSFEYDSNYGYPTKANVKMQLAQDAEYRIEVKSVQLNH